MIELRFKDVGGDKKSWTALVTRLTPGTLRRQVHERRAIVSLHPDFEIFADGTGKVFAGLREVGSFEWSQIE